MKVLLTKDIKGLGRAGEVKDVSDGHARNFLLPRHLVLPATTSVLAKVQKEEQEHIEKAARQLEKFLALKSKLENQILTIKAKAQKEHLFAAIHEKEIAQALMEKLGIEVAPQQIKISKPLKNLGEHEVEIQFAKDHVALIRLSVEAS